MSPPFRILIAHFRAAPVSGGNVAFTVTFSTPVCGVDSADFTLATSGTVTDASVLAVSAVNPVNGLSETYTVTVAPGAGWGTLELDVADDDSITDGFGHPLGGPGAGNGDYFGTTLTPGLAFTSTNTITAGTVTAIEGTPISLSLGTNFYTLPAATTWQIDWGDGTVDPMTGSVPSDSHAYTTGDGTYNIAATALTPDGQQFYTDFIPVSVAPAPPTMSATLGDGSATITWATPSPLTLWMKLEMAVDGGGYALYAEGISPAAQTFTIADLPPAHNYDFRLTASNSASATSAVMAASVEANLAINTESESFTRVDDTVKFRIVSPFAPTDIAMYSVQIQERIHDAAGIHFSGNWHDVYESPILPTDANGYYANLTLQVASHYRVRLVETTSDARQVASDPIEFDTAVPPTLGSYHDVFFNAFGQLDVQGGGGDWLDRWSYTRSQDNYYPDQWFWGGISDCSGMQDEICAGLYSVPGYADMLDDSGLVKPPGLGTITGALDAATGQVTLTGWTPPGADYSLEVQQTDSTSGNSMRVASGDGASSSITFNSPAIADWLSPDQSAGVYAVNAVKQTVPYYWGRLSNRLVVGIAPVMPSSFMAVPVVVNGVPQVNLAWQDDNACESYYQVQRWDAVAQAWQDVTVANSNQIADTTAVDTSDPARNPLLVYQVRAARVVGTTTLYSAWASATAPVHLPQPHLSVRDNAPGGATFTDTNVGIMGVVEDSTGTGSFSLSLVNGPFDTLENVYTYHVCNAAGTEIYSAALPPTSLINFTTSDPGLHSIIVTSSVDPNFQRSVRYYLARLNIKWNEPDDPNVSNIWYGNITPISFGDNISRERVDIYAGQRIDLSYDTDLPVSSISVRRWATTDTDVIKGFQVATNFNSGGPIPMGPSDFNGTSLLLYGFTDVTNGMFTISLSARVVDGSTVIFSNSTAFNIHKPGQSIWTGNKIIAGKVGLQYFQARVVLNPAFMESGILSNFLAGEAEWQTAVPDPLELNYEGTINWAQLTSYDMYWIGRGYWQHTSNGEFKLDSAYPYNAIPGVTDDGDTPDFGCYLPLAYTIRLFRSFHDWLLWTPPGGDSIAVPLQKWSWTVDAKAVYSDLTLSWTVSQYGIRASTVIYGSDTSIYPKWSTKE